MPPPTPIAVPRRSASASTTRRLRISTGPLIWTRPYAIAYSNRGNAKERLGQHDAAFADYDRAIELDPNYAIAYSNRGAAKHSLGQYDAALADYNRAIELDPNYAAAYSNRGNAKERLGQHDAAFADLRPGH